MKIQIALSLIILTTLNGQAQIPLLNEDIVRSLHGELSGEAAKRNLEYITRFHRMRGSADFKEAINFVEGKLREYKLQEIEVIQIPIDGKTFYGTQKSRLAWEAESAELWELDDTGKPTVRIADWQSMPITLAEDSESGEVTAELIDIGAGTSEQDYAGKKIKGNLVLTSSPPEAVVPLAIEKYGSAGIISYTQNQVTAWWKEDENLIRWGHLDSFSPVHTFCFMISLKQARAFQQRLARGESGLMQRHPTMCMCHSRGSVSSLRSGFIIYICHVGQGATGRSWHSASLHCQALLTRLRTHALTLAAMWPDKNSVSKKRSTIF